MEYRVRAFDMVLYDRVTQGRRSKRKQDGHGHGGIMPVLCYKRLSKYDVLLRSTFSTRTLSHSSLSTSLRHLTMPALLVLRLHPQVTHTFLHGQEQARVDPIFSALRRLRLLVHFLDLWFLSGVFVFAFAVSAAVAFVFTTCCAKGVERRAVSTPAALYGVVHARIQGNQQTRS